MSNYNILSLRLLVRAIAACLIDISCEETDNLA